MKEQKITLETAKLLFSKGYQIISEYFYSEIYGLCKINSSDFLITESDVIYVGDIDINYGQ